MIDKAKPEKENCLDGSDDAFIKCSKCGSIDSKVCAMPICELCLERMIMVQESMSNGDPLSECRCTCEE